MKRLVPAFILVLDPRRPGHGLCTAVSVHSASGSCIYRISPDQPLQLFWKMEMALDYSIRCSVYAGALRYLKRRKHIVHRTSVCAGLHSSPCRSADLPGRNADRRPDTPFKMRKITCLPVFFNAIQKSRERIPFIHKSFAILF